MTFGTTGLGSAIGAGLCYINDLTAVQSTQRMHKYLEGSCSDFMQSSFAWVCHPGCRNQQLWQSEIGRLPAAGLWLSMVPWCLFSRQLPTPLVSSAVRSSEQVQVWVMASHKENSKIQGLFGNSSSDHLMIKKFQEAEKLPIPLPKPKDPDADFSAVKGPKPEVGESVLELSRQRGEMPRKRSRRS
ncbi:hypothetical protein MC885_011349 [Smutsia gigantea]|nr:hypothetical protein MC885_011349 [Smutsia gigantea]